jgi:hypothetical protein
MGRYLRNDEFQRLVDKVDRLERAIKKQQSTEAEEIAQEGISDTSFDKIDNTIIAFVVSAEDGPSQSDIVQHIRKELSDLTGTSRVPLLKRIYSLVKYKVLIERVDSKNRQMKRYYIDKESLLLQLDRYFDNFEKALIDLIKAFVRKNGGGAIMGQKPEEIYFFTMIFELYQHVRGIAMTHATFNWPKITNDPVLLNRLYKTLFGKLIILQENLSKALGEAGVDTYRNFVYSSWMLRPEVIDVGISIAQKYDLQREALVHAFDLAWSIGAPVAKYARLKFEKNPPAEGIADNDIDDIQKWNAPTGWKEAYLHWKAQEP